jgi:diguanylate cyclase (GGDEF)-like protein/PAS domain S-box-containing protein
MDITSIDGKSVSIDRLQETLLSELTDGVYFVDRNRRVLYWNKACEQLTGYSADEVLGSSCSDGILTHVDSRGNHLCDKDCPLAGVMQDGRNRQSHVFMHHADGHRVPVHVRGAAIHDQHGSIIGAVEIFSDDTERMGALDRLKELEEAALLDELTGVANRRFLNRELDACLAEFARNETQFGMALIDIDHFKRVNDTYGHDVGDAVLRMVARTLSLNCRPYDMPARWGGEEFAIISKHVNAESLYAVAERARVLVAESYHDTGDDSVRVTVSIGVSMARPGDSAEALAKRADTNLYRSKESGRNRTTADAV